MHCSCLKDLVLVVNWLLVYFSSIYRFRISCGYTARVFIDLRLIWIRCVCLSEFRGGCGFTARVFRVLGIVVDLLFVPFRWMFVGSLLVSL